MPGPNATNRTHRAPAPNSPNKKTRARLARRQELVPSSGYYPIGVKTGWFVKPGSQNRKK